VLAGLFIAADVAVDRALADSPGTLHHPRPLLLMLPALVLVAVLWRARDQVGTLGRIGVGMCATGGIANMVCTAVDGDGVSDYIRFQISHYLIVINLADLPPVSLNMRGSGRGTIRFGEAYNRWNRGGAWTPALDPTPQFIAIDNAQGVFDLIHKARDDMSRPQADF